MNAQDQPFATAADGRLQAIAEAFAIATPVRGLAPLGSGNVNDTYRVEAADGSLYVLQRLNTGVFPRPELVMGNIATLGEHLDGRPAPRLRSGRSWELPRLVPARSGGASWLERDGQAWRLLTHIDDSVSHDTVQDSGHAREVGRALGRFHLLIHDLPCAQLADTLEGFHVTPRYLAAYQELLDSRGLDQACEASRFCRAFVAEREALVPALEQARLQGRLQERPIHGDPKVNNVLLDRRSGEAVALVDLDTVKPGLVQYDIGDCLRSGCNPAGEEAADLNAVSFDLALCRPMLGGYLELARPFLTPADLELIPTAVRLISFELGLRFFSDHLAGNRYFKCRHPRHNLERALVQFRLVQSIEAQQGAIEALVEELG
ncbi:phosphotransferase enzyme family protein [Cyanobium sp. CH-040]|uniref:phosphotransferase enzyme family protein n=1 Tax=Cyanobium sp. CH-040 TaxID=2823708 RepID=UPI0020CDA388|nr:aminoglycoside phosphotransferase family protein [Cyanobium sp. CH-040]MCP9926806.1 aminoglycoside phosphotransferase family protein [Cyanobium sp. CH-040]